MKSLPACPARARHGLPACLPACLAPLRGQAGRAGRKCRRWERPLSGRLQGVRVHARGLADNRKCASAEWPCSRTRRTWHVEFFPAAGITPSRTVEITAHDKAFNCLFVASVSTTAPTYDRAPVRAMAVPRRSTTGHVSMPPTVQPVPPARALPILFRAFLVTGPLRTGGLAHGR